MELKIFLGNKEIVPKKKIKNFLSSKILELKILLGKKYKKKCQKKFSACGGQPGLFYFPLLIFVLFLNIFLSSKILELKKFLGNKKLFWKNAKKILRLRRAARIVLLPFVFFLKFSLRFFGK